MMTGESNELWNSVLNENVALRRQVTEMEGFLEDHGLVWVGTGATISLPISFVQNTVESEKVRRFQKSYFSSRARPFLNEDTDLGSSVCVTDTAHQNGSNKSQVVSQPLFCLCT